MSDQMTPGPAGAGPAPEEQLARLRSSIDNNDAALIHMLAERFRCTQEVGELKGAHLDPGFAERWFNVVVAAVIQHHTRIAGEREA